jgi:dolichol-phosphate hexosyltransferase
VERVAFVIPTLNEAPSIGFVIESIPVAELAKDGYETAVYVIDGRSVDHTREIAVEKGAEVITEQRSGKGAAIQTAFRAVDADYVIVVDGDNTYPISVATEMVRLLQTNDVVIGSRLKGCIEPGAMTRLNVVGNILLTSLARLLLNVQVSDICSGLWGYRRHAIRSLELSAEGFAIEVDMFAECARNGFHIAEIPITYRARGENPAKLSSVRDGVRIGTFLITKYLSQKKARNIQSRVKTTGRHE